MNNYFTLLAGEIQRMQKYHIYGAGLLVAFLWIGVLYFIDIEDISSIFPLLIFVDASSMALLLIGVTMFFEKQEGSLKTLLVSPINKVEYIMAKTTANMTSNIMTLALLYLYARIFKEIDLNILGLLGAVILISFFHSLVGFMLTYNARDFTDLLMAMMKYFFVLMLPVILELVGMITNEFITKLFYILPTKASMTLLLASAGGFPAWEIILSVTFLVMLGIILFLRVLVKFDDFASKESGA